MLQRLARFLIGFGGATLFVACLTQHPLNVGGRAGVGLALLGLGVVAAVADRHLALREQRPDSERHLAARG